MSFSPDWLALRARFDSAARSTALESRLADWAAARAHRGPLSVIDLGAGSGNNLAHLKQRLGVDQRWTLLDSDPALLAEAARRHPDAAVRQADLADDLSALIPTGTDLVTASALIDLVPQTWLQRLVERVLALNCALFVVLTYDGRIAWETETAGDREIRALVNRHQHGDKGMGPALGPGAPDALKSLLPGIEAARSDWEVAAGDAAMRAALVDGWASAAKEIASERSADIASWRASAVDRPRAVTVGHADQLWLPSA